MDDDDAPLRPPPMPVRAADTEAGNVGAGTGAGAGASTRTSGGDAYAATSSEVAPWESATATAPAPATTAAAATDDRIRVLRDWSEGELCRFAIEMPEALEGKIDRAQFVYTIDRVNAIFLDAESVNRANVTESILGYLSCYVSYAIIKTHYEKCMDVLAAFLDEQNTQVYRPAGFELKHPLRNGLQSIEIVKL